MTGRYQEGYVAGHKKGLEDCAADHEALVFGQDDLRAELRRLRAELERLRAALEKEEQALERADAKVLALTLEVNELRRALEGK